MFDDIPRATYFYKSLIAASNSNQNSTLQNFIDTQFSNTVWEHQTTHIYRHITVTFHPLNVRRLVSA